jgi:hypothetical protein
MSENFFKVPKQLCPVTLWVHPEGRVIGSLFVREQSLHHIGKESPAELLNQEDPFVVVNRDSPDELRFYRKSAIVRVEYQGDDVMLEEDIVPICCELHLMDGSMLLGEIRSPMPKDKSRLYDYLNRASDLFVKLHLEDDLVTLVNKQYIIYAKNLAKCS